MRRKHTSGKLKRDLFIIAISIAATILAAYFGLFDTFFTATQRMKIAGTVLAGSLFTSAFTIAPATLALAEISRTTSIISVAFWGAIGACIGDLIIFLFVRDSLADDVTEMMRGHRFDRIKAIFKLRFFRRISPFIGALIIASPLPDEFGLALMGFTKMKVLTFLPIAFVMNFIGVLAIAIFANAL